MSSSSINCDHSDEDVTENNTPPEDGTSFDNKNKSIITSTVITSKRRKMKYESKIRQNLAHHVPAHGCPLTKSEIFHHGQLQKDITFQDTIHNYGIEVQHLIHNASTAILYEFALKYEPETRISNTGAICCLSGEKTGRSPGDKRIVEEITSVDHIDWNKVNIRMSERSYEINRERAIDFLNTQSRLYIVDAYAGWDDQYKIKVRVIMTRAYHALFMQNMLVLPSSEELENFKPDFIIYNSGCFPANRYTECVTSQTCVAVNFKKGEMVILGTQYAGEMKKGLLTLLMYKMPFMNNLPLHSSCNVGFERNDVCLFFGLSGTGKTTLSSDVNRQLIGDDEHVWTDTGVFNIEGGCYAKCNGLSKEQEPEIFDAIKFGSVLENVILNDNTRVVDFLDISITENTRASYPLSHVKNARIPAIIDVQPSNIIFLSCDAFGVLPPVSKLSVEQALYYFLSGYTSKMAGTEEGVHKPIATFSACFGAPFLPLHPCRYSELLRDKLKKVNCHVWQVNTGWIGGSYGDEGSRRIPLKYTRKMIEYIQNGTLINYNYTQTKCFDFSVPVSIDDIPDEVLHPELAWKNNGRSSDYENQLKKLAVIFVENFKQYEDRVQSDVKEAGPHF